MLSHPHPWIARVRHDLVKRLLWVARDCRDAPRVPAPGELIALLYDDEGQSIDAISLWERLRDDAPEKTGLDAFGCALNACVEAARRNDLAGVLALEAAFERLQTDLASSLNKTGSMGSPDRKAR
jgi:hypothetical protein